MYTVLVAYAADISGSPNALYADIAEKYVRRTCKKVAEASCKHVNDAIAKGVRGFVDT
jgi:hypothetical protein